MTSTRRKTLDEFIADAMKTLYKLVSSDAVYNGKPVTATFYSGNTVNTVKNPFSEEEFEEFKKEMDRK